MHTALMRPVRGQLVVIAFVFMSVILTMSAVLASYITLYVHGEHIAATSAQALAAAEGGLDNAIYALNQNSAYSGETRTILGSGAVDVSVATVDAHTKRITATGYVPPTNPVSTHTLTVEISSSSVVVPLRYGAQVGAGGVTMGSGSSIQGDLFSNGNVSGSGTVTGNATVAGGASATEDQSWTLQNGNIPVGNVTTQADVAQSFIPGTTGALSKVSLYLKKVGLPGTLTVDIMTDNAGVPSQTVLASGSIATSLVGGSYAFVDASFGATPTLSAGTTYWIVVIASTDANNYFLWGDDTANGYSNGTAKNSADWSAGSPVWGLVGGDADFKTWMGGTVTSLSGITVDGNAWAHALSSCTIVGNASYQSNDGCSVGGTSYPASADADAGAMPITAADITNWESAATAGGVLSGDYVLDTGASASLGPKEIDGNLSISNGSTLTVTGVVWVRGNVTLSNNSTLAVSAATGNEGAILIADVPGSTGTKGTIAIQNGANVSGNGQSGSSLLFVTTNTGGSAITLANNAATVILAAPYGTVSVSNNAHAHQVSAYALTLSNNTSVQYDENAQSQSFYNGPSSTWAMVPGTYLITH